MTTFNSNFHNNKWSELEDFYLSVNKNIMNQSSFFSLNWTDVKQALSLVIVTLVIQICGYIISVGDIFAISLHALANAAIIPCLVLIVSLLQTGFTTSDGRFLGTFTVK